MSAVIFKTNLAHLIVRKDHVLCTRCYEVVPVHAGNGTPMGSLLLAYKSLERKHSKCGEAK